MDLRELLDDLQTLASWKRGEVRGFDPVVEVGRAEESCSAGWFLGEVTIDLVVAHLKL